MSGPRQVSPQAAALAQQAAAALTGQKLAEAETLSRQALRLNPQEPRAISTLSGVLQLRGRFDEALALADAVLARDPKSAAAWLARGDSLANTGRHEEALAAYRKGLATGEMAFDAQLRIGMSAGALGRTDEALESLEAALTIDPAAVQPRYQRGVLRLTVRDFAQGWDDYEARWESERFVAASRGLVPPPVVPLLKTSPTVEDLTGKRVLVIGEQGLGDEIMFASILPDLARVAGEVTCVVEPRLARLFQASFEGVRTVPPTEARIDTDVLDAIVAIGSLPAAFRRDEAAFPGTPFLKPRDEVVARWAERLGSRRASLRVGIAWRGGLPHTRSLSRSLSLMQLAPVLALPGCEFVSLQHGDVAELAAFPQVRAFPAAELQDFEELAGLVANLDIVVSVQTALVHLCGAIGQTCLTLLPSTPEWRYTAAGPTLPWYRSVRLFRQAEPGAWGPVAEHIAADLSPRLGPPPT